MVINEIENNRIDNITQYNNSMSKSLIDKMFFMGKIDDDIKFIFDYGCADGRLIHFLAMLFPSITFIGYDISETMIKTARELCADQNNVLLFSNISGFNEWAKENFDFSKALLNLSSVIHEVYSYCSEDEIEAFWEFATKKGFKYIAIRDMCLDQSAHRCSLKEDVLRIYSKYDRGRLGQFEKINGSLTDNFNLIHFLLKYRYTENWEKEVRENYLPLSVDKFTSKIITANYKLEYFDHYILPCLARTVERDFGIIIKDYTHVKFIFRLAPLQAQTSDNKT